VHVIGLTGGIGSGKSTVASMLAQRGAHVIDVDAVGREVIAPGGRAEQAVLHEFGPAVVGADGHIDRAALAGIVFGDPEALVRLTAISHPAIDAELVERMRVLPDDVVVVLDMAVLAESSLGRSDPEFRYSQVLVVEAPAEVRVERAVARGMSESDVRNRMAAQASDEQRRALAAVVIDNDGDLDTLRRRVDAAWTHLMAIHAAAVSGGETAGDPACWLEIDDSDDDGVRAVRFDLAMAELGGRSGAVWSLPHGGDLDANLVHLVAGDAIGEHRNDEVDVLMVVRSGSGEVVVDGRRSGLSEGVVVLVPKGASRAIRADDAGLAYLSIHRRRSGPTIRTSPRRT
jgi:dephospho-CoA kinase